MEVTGIDTRGRNGIGTEEGNWVEETEISLRHAERL